MLCTLHQTTLAVLTAVLSASAAAAQTPFVFSTGPVDGRMAMASRPQAPGRSEREAADDFTLGSSTRLTNATFRGLLSAGTSFGGISSVTVEIYRVFPFDSDVGRTSGPPTFSTSQVPTRVNSPSDVALDSRTSGAGLTYTTSVIASSFTAANSVLDGINPTPNQTTGGEGAVTGQEVEFAVDFTSPVTLEAGHYFFVPQVGVAAGNFFWLSAVRPIVAPGTPFAPDLQAWIRSGALDPDWLRVGTDIVGGAPAPTFNGAFTLNGTVVPEPATVLLVASGLAGLGWVRGRRRGAAA